MLQYNGTAAGPDSWAVCSMNGPQKHNPLPAIPGQDVPKIVDVVMRNCR